MSLSFSQIDMCGNIISPFIIYGTSVIDNNEH